MWLLSTRTLTPAFLSKPLSWVCPTSFCLSFACLFPLTVQFLPLRLPLRLKSPNVSLEFDVKLFSKGCKISQCVRASLAELGMYLKTLNTICAQKKMLVLVLASEVFVSLTGKNGNTSKHLTSNSLRCTAVWRLLLGPPLAFVECGKFGWWAPGWAHGDCSSHEDMLFQTYLHAVCPWLLPWQPLSFPRLPPAGPPGHDPLSSLPPLFFFFLQISSLTGWPLHPSVTWGWTHQWGASQWVRVVSPSRPSSASTTPLGHALTECVAHLYIFALMSDVVGIPVSLSVL